MVGFTWEKLGLFWGSVKLQCLNMEGSENKGKDNVGFEKFGKKEEIDGEMSGFILEIVLIFMYVVFGYYFKALRVQIRNEEVTISGFWRTGVEGKLYIHDTWVCIWV